MTCLPPTIGPIKPSGDVLKGIFYELKKYVANPVSENIVTLYSTTSKGNIESVVMWNGDWATRIGTEYLEISFPKHYLFPTHYTLRSPSMSYYYPKKWIVYGYNSESDRSDQNKWVELHKGISSDSVFCGTQPDCDGQRTNTFQMYGLNKSTHFKFIRFVNVEHSSSNVHFVTSGIDFYGYLSIEDHISIQDNNKCTIVYIFPHFLLHYSQLTYIFILLESC